MVSISTLSGIFDKKIGPLFGIFVPNGGLQNTILRAVLGKMASIFQRVLTERHWPRVTYLVNNSV